MVNRTRTSGHRNPQERAFSGARHVSGRHAADSACKSTLEDDASHLSALTTSFATVPSMSSAFSLAKGRGMSYRPRTTLEPTFTSKQPLRGFSGLTVTFVEGSSFLMAASSLAARVLNASAAGVDRRSDYGSLQLIRMGLALPQ